MRNMTHDRLVQNENLFQVLKMGPRSDICSLWNAHGTAVTSGMHEDFIGTLNKAVKIVHQLRAP